MLAAHIKRYLQDSWEWNWIPENSNFRKDAIAQAKTQPAIEAEIEIEELQGEFYEPRF